MKIVVEFGQTIENVEEKRMVVTYHHYYIQGLSLYDLINFFCLIFIYMITLPVLVFVRYIDILRCQVYQYGSKFHYKVIFMIEGDQYLLFQPLNKHVCMTPTHR